MRKRLRIERIRRHMTQSDMAEYLQISQSAYSMIERGTRSGRRWVWDKLERLFRVDREALRAISHGEDDRAIRSAGKYAGV